MGLFQFLPMPFGLSGVPASFQWLMDEVCRGLPFATSSSPMKAPLVNVPIGKAQEMIAVDVLEVPVSHHNNWYLLLIQEYFMKWVEAVPLPD